MKRILCVILIIGVVTGLSANDNLSVTVIEVRGEVKVRHGLEESWHLVKDGTELKVIDTILTGAHAAVILAISGKGRFRLEANAMLDIGDLRNLTEKELFLLLMSKKIQRINSTGEKTRLRVGNVSSVHGESKQDTQQTDVSIERRQFWEREKNGAKALYKHRYYTNCIMKLTNILIKYSTFQDCGEIHFYLGKSFEALNKRGQAVDAYQTVIRIQKEQHCSGTKEDKWLNESKAAVKRLQEG